MKRPLEIQVFVALCASLLLFTFNSFATEKLRYIGDQNILTGEKFKETELGGLSGITYDKEKKKLLAISDDKGAVNDPRFYEFNLSMDEKSFKISTDEVIILKDKEGKPFKNGSVDFEGITLFGGDILISSEGALNKEPLINAEIFQFNRQGSYKANLDIPTQFLRSKDISKYGPRENLIFEALSASKDGKIVWVGTEEALEQDDRPSTPTHASTIRLILYKNLKPEKQFAYKLEKVPTVKVADLAVGETGLSGLLTVDETHFYSIERSYLSLARKNVIRIFKNTVTEKTTDISKMDSLNVKTVNTVEKELIADLEDFQSQMSPNFQSLDNIEGICFGPQLPNGNDSIILVSDNNFNKKQRTQFLAFEIIP
ncbi:MAG: esterase-like activity of phytase family protein [Bacteriovorax sp.]|nr:esterase-like activity of phytase family protein [Bacteriovorax sp.]